MYVVDDDPTLLSSLARVLQHAGYDVDTFASAEAFLARARPDAASCLLVDLVMPGLSGLALQQLLGRGEDGGGPAVVLMSGRAGVPEAVQAMKAGAVDVLEKPFANPRLLEAVARALRAGAERAATREARASARERLARLTPRERQICELVAAGRTTPAIAGELRLAESTVSLHRAHVMRKLEVSSVAELVALVDRAGRAGAGA